MAGRKAATAAGLRLVELAKDILIVTLTCSAVLLAARTPMFNQVRGWITPPVQVSQPPAWQSEDAVIPAVICVRNSLGLYGVSYDDDLVGQAFWGDHLSSFLGEGLASADAPGRIGRQKWQSLLLECPGIYCQFPGALPLETLQVWLGGQEKGNGLTGAALALVLVQSGDQVCLAWQDRNGAYYLAPTKVTYEGRLETVLEEYAPNGAAYAYTLAEEDRAYTHLAPFELISMTSPQPQSWSVSAPDFVGNHNELETLLKALGFHSWAGSTYESGGELVINEGSDRLRVDSFGAVTFRAGEQIRYPVNSGSPSATQAALCAWNLLNQAAAPWKGETSYVLTGVEETTQGWCVTFHSRLDGVDVLTGEEGWCACFTVTSKGVTDFTLLLRKYAPTGTTSLLPTQRLAAAALSSIPESDGHLLLCYPDPGSGIMEAIWRTEILRRHEEE